MTGHDRFSEKFICSDLFPRPFLSKSNFLRKGKPKAFNPLLNYEIYHCVV